MQRAAELEELAECRREISESLRELRQLRQDLAKDHAGKTFGELAADWLRRISKRRVCPANDERAIRHMGTLAVMREGELTKGRIDDVFASLLKPAGPLGPATINKVRSVGRLIVEDAQGNREWRGFNPFDLVRPLRQTRRLYNTLTLAEVVRVLPHLRPDRRREAKVILLVGMRPGEVLGLRKVDVDLGRKMLRVRRSHGRNQTKTGKEREFPIPDELVEDLRDAMRQALSEHVFPKPDGTRQRADTKFSRTLRTAMKAGRVCIGYRYKCRRKGCGHLEIREEEATGLRCPACDFKLWCTPIPKPMRYYDLRHSSATLHRRAKCDPLVIMEMLGHAATNTTDATYTHLDEEYRRAEVNKLKLESDA